MILAIDVKYNETTRIAKAVGLLFNWLDDKPIKIIEVFVHDVQDYIPGKFYKRELPCIKKVIDKVELSNIDAIIVDGHVFISNEKEFGLGAYTYEEYNRKIPVIGIAKTPFYKNKDTVKDVFRGDSKKPLYVSVIGEKNIEDIKEKIIQMKGSYRIPKLLKELDRKTKEF